MDFDGVRALEAERRVVRAAFLVNSPRSSALRALNYEPRVERLRAKSKSTVALTDLLSSFGESYGSVFAAEECAPGHGVELLSQRDMFRSEPEGKWIRASSLPRPTDHLIHKWQILIAATGTLAPTELYGRSILADDRLAGRYLGPDGLALTFKEPGNDLSLYVAAFLYTDTGVAAVRSLSAGTKLLRPRLDMLEQLRIPIPESASIKAIAELLRCAVVNREIYFQKLRAARSIVEMMPAIRDAKLMCAERSRRAALWKGPLPTLSAWNFSSAGEALGSLNKTWSTRLRDVLQPNGVFNGPRFARVECQRPHGIDFYSQRDVFLMRPIPRRIVHPSVSDRMLFVPPDAVLAGSHGQLTDGGIFGKVELASFGAHRAGLTQDLLRLLFREGERATAFAFLSTIVGERLLKTTAVGTSIPAMRLDLLEQLPYPEFTAIERRRITETVREAESARVDAGKAEAEAIRLMDEEVLPAWLA